MRKILFALALAVSLLTAGTASAHMFWINLVEATNHPPGHVMAGLSFGHTLPMDDFLVGKDGSIHIAQYDVVTPEQKKLPLGLPDETYRPAEKKDGLEVSRGDLALRKIEMTKDSAPGTYQVEATSKPVFFTVYQDEKGKQRMAPKPIDAIKGVSKVISSFKYVSYAKSFFTMDKWTKPQPLGHDLEIIPLDNLSDVHVGDLIRFQVTYMGKPVNVTPNAIRSMSCTSNTFGGPDKFYLGTYIYNGIAQFRMPTPGQWVANVLYSQDVEKDPTLSDLKGKCHTVYTGSTIGFNVKP